MLFEPTQAGDFPAKNLFIMTPQIITVMARFLFHLFHRRAPIFNFLLGLKIIANRPGSWIVLPLQISWAARALRTFVFHTPNPRISMFWPEIIAAFIISNTVF